MFRDKVFKKRLFGYSKIDVIDYLNVLSQDFSKRLLEQEENSKKEAAILRKKIEQLELEKKELIDKEALVADILLGAQKYNNSIRQSLDLKLRSSYDDLIIKIENETERLNDYKRSIDRLRSASKDMLESVLSEIEFADIEIDPIKKPTFEEFKSSLDNEEVNILKYSD